MTRSEAHRRALSAAAKIAFGLTAACASDPPPPQTPTTPAGPSTQTGSQATAPAPAAAQTGPSGCALSSSANVSDEEASCCLAAANAALPRNGTEAVPDHVKQCCKLVVATKKTVGYDACCELTKTMTGSCTPWGPPVPPRMARLRS